MKIKWKLSGVKKESFEVNYAFENNTEQNCKLSINNIRYKLAADSLSNQSFKAILNLNKINDIELFLEDESNPNKGLSIDELRIEIK